MKAELDEVVLECQDEDCGYIWTMTEKEYEAELGAVECINCGSTDVDRN